VKLCGCKENCFEVGACWGHLDGVLCKNLGEKEIDNEIKTICFTTKEKVNLYTTEEEYENKQ
jgi:hypothetical protein